MDQLPSDLTAQLQVPRRTRARVILSCRLCRSLKLKCDRKAPCTQCQRRGYTTEECVYEPKPPKMRKSRSMAARLQEIQGTIRQIIHESPGSSHTSTSSNADTNKKTVARVVTDQRGKSTYVGATHFMTVLDDLEDLKQFFDNSDSEDDDSPAPGFSSQDGHILQSFLLSERMPKGKGDLLRLLPPSQTLNAMAMRYFAWHPPSSAVIHRPTFNTQFRSFLAARDEATYEFIALIFMILAEATLFANFSVQGEIMSDSPLPPPDRVRVYRSAGVCALNSANYTSPSLDTIAPLLLHLEAEFVISRSTPMRCYLLSSTCIRLMLRLGLHRDPSHFPSISVLTGEMRRRMWHFGLQIEMLVSFQLGLPSFMSGISTDTSLPRNVLDQDLALDTKELPAVRPDSANGPLTYFNWKTTIGQVFGLIAQKTNMSESISDAEVVRLDGMLNNVWDRVPGFLKMRSLEECVADEPLLVMERMSLCCIYEKAVCVLHRHHMSTGQLDEEHSSSRQSCFDAACRLLDCQAMFFEGTRPGSLLSQYTWFLRPILTGDFLLAAVIIYLGLNRGMRSSSSQSDGREARQLLERSHSIWASMAADDPSYLKAVKVLATMLRRASNKMEETHNHDQAADTTGDENIGAVDANLHSKSLSGALSLPTSDTSLEDDLAWLPSNDDALDWRAIDEAMLFDEQSAGLSFEWDTEMLSFESLKKT